MACYWSEGGESRGVSFGRTLLLIALGGLLIAAAVCGVGCTGGV